MSKLAITEKQWEKIQRKLQTVKRCFKNGESDEGYALADEVISDVNSWKDQKLMVPDDEEIKNPEPDEEVDDTEMSEEEKILSQDEEE